ncbi:MAG: fibrinogen-like YCDxxxxGGGW domain-containing protein, partial [Ilumatobacteraceae bacterium]
MALAAASALAAGAAIVGSAAAPAEAQVAAPASGVGSGTSAADAAGSCWEIKQLHPGSVDGVYWLRTTTLVRPEQFYCDMTTDGGGWVLIGRGREGWTFRDYGQSTTANLRDNPEGPAAFSPAALSSETIDGLLDGGNVKDLTDGVRLRRAENKSGTQWQDLRWNFADLESWSWALGGGHRLSSFSIDGQSGSGSNTKDSNVKMWGESGSGNRGASDLQGWYTYPWSGHGRQAGFSYRGSVDGERDSTSYLYEYNRENQAIPFTQMFIRPQVATSVSAPIDDSGLPEQTLTPMLDDRPEEIAGGVSGILNVGDSFTQLTSPVLALEPFGDRIYVGGKFRDVRDAATGELVRHSYLAAFDKATGAWIPSFRPILDGTVWDLEVVDGRLIVAGQFTNIDGVSGTSALAAIDPITGAVDQSWTASMSGGGDRSVVRSIDVDGDWIYVGGNFTRIAGPSRSISVGRLARVAVANGDPDRAFRPNVDGIPFDIDALDGRVQLVGSFHGINGVERRSVGTVDADDGSVVPGLAEAVWSSSNNRYQFAVLPIGDEVWQGGSEHNTQVYRAGDYALLKSFITHDQGGDTQVLSQAGDKVLQGSHANAYVYSDATLWPGVTGYTRTDIFNWIGMFDVETREYERDWVPGIASGYGWGTWAIEPDVDGCVWFGGDLLGGPYVNGQRQYLEGFSKFCQRDAVAPTSPTDALASIRADGGVTVSWGLATDNAAVYIGYEVLRNDRVVSPLVYGSSYVDPSGTAADRYFVRAVDSTGNRSATTPVAVPADNLPPSTPQDLEAIVNPDHTVTLNWTASTDDVVVESYLVFRNGEQIVVVPGEETTTLVAGLDRGTHAFQVQAVDNAGNQSWKTPSAVVDVGGDDVSAPSVPTDLNVTGDVDGPSVTATWTASVDDVGIDGYVVYVNGALLATVAGDVTAATVGVGFGDQYVQVAARDAAGNESWKTEPVMVTLVEPPTADTSNPSTPRNVAAVAEADGSVSVSWTASS